MQFECIESRYLAYIVAKKLCYVKIKWHSKRVLSVTLFIFVSVYVSILYQYYINYRGKTILPGQGEGGVSGTGITPKRGGGVLGTGTK